MYSFIIRIFYFCMKYKTKKQSLNRLRACSRRNKVLNNWDQTHFHRIDRDILPSAVSATYCGQLLEKQMGRGSSRVLHFSIL